MDVEHAIVEETPVAAMPGDSATTAFVEETAVTALDVEERWPRLGRLPRTVSTPRASPPAEFVFVSGASVLVPPSPTPHRRRRRRRAHAAEDPAPGDERRRRDRRRRRRRKPQGVSPLASPTSSMSFPDWASPTSSIASALSSPWSSPRHENPHHFPRRGDSGGSSSSFWSSKTSLWSSTTSMFSSTTSSLRSWASSSSASSLLSFAAAPAQGDGPDHYRPDSPDDFRVACRDVSMPLPEERSSEASSS
ncbi:unnamed protein product [Pelagomonas calceolata]|uniref:Uncharacterized protein n=1 Tax=Pelagomonas calceolata TaxID=35677 RepID=A0A8J2WZS7_9STRA|nr:unnamed protein product [Pelagomonas calceolata]